MSDMIENATFLLQQIEEDHSVPKNIRIRVKNAIDVLGAENGKDLAVKADQAIEELDSISDDTNLPPYTRTQIWQILTLLESNK